MKGWLLQMVKLNFGLCYNVLFFKEPGFYKEGFFGIRIEDDLVVVNKGDGYLGFENLTLCFYDRNLMSLELLNQRDIEFID